MNIIWEENSKAGFLWCTGRISFGKWHPDAFLVGKEKGEIGVSFFQLDCNRIVGNIFGKSRVLRSLAVESLERVFHIFHKEIKELSTKNTLNFSSRDAMIFMSKRWLHVVDKNDDIVWRP